MLNWFRSSFDNTKHTEHVRFRRIKFAKAREISYALLTMVLLWPGGSGGIAKWTELWFLPSAISCHRTSCASPRIVSLNLIYGMHDKGSTWKKKQNKFLFVVDFEQTLLSFERNRCRHHTCTQTYAGTFRLVTCDRNSMILWFWGFMWQTSHVSCRRGLFVTAIFPQRFCFNFRSARIRSQRLLVEAKTETADWSISECSQLNQSLEWLGSLTAPNTLSSWTPSNIPKYPKCTWKNPRKQFKCLSAIGQTRVQT